MSVSSDSMILTVANRLSRHAPFDRLQPGLLDSIARGIRIRYLEPNEIIFDEGQEPKDEFYVVVKGEIAVTQMVDGESVLIDVCDGGDIFGVRALLAGRTYAARAEAKDDTLLYVLSKAHLDGMYYKPRIDKEHLAKWSEGIICLSGCITGEINQFIQNDQLDLARESLESFLQIFGRDHFYLEVHDHGLGAQHKCKAALIDFAVE